MTIVAGFPGAPANNLPGFVVLGADSEESGGLIKSSVRKVAKIDKGKWKLLVAGAGSGDFIDLAIEQIEDELPPDLDRHEIRQEIEEIVTAIYIERIDNYPQHRQDDMEFQLLCAIWVAGDMRVDLVRVGRAVSLAQKGPTTIGIGEHLARYLISTIYTPGLPLYHNTRFAVYLLAQVKKHVAACGGTSQVVWLDGNGETGELWPGTVSQHELSTSVVMDGGARWLFDFVELKGITGQWSVEAIALVLDAFPELAEALRSTLPQTCREASSSLQDPKPATSPSGFAHIHRSKRRGARLKARAKPKETERC